jgi:hypothetical protein
MIYGNSGPLDLGLEKRKLEQEGHAAMSEKSKLEGQCWLCGRWRELTREHIPPKSAFNNYPILLYTVEENTRKTGRMEWAGRVEQGLVVRSLCGECNSKGGGQYGSHYADFIARVAPAVERARDGEQIITSGVQRPLSILKQIMQTFVSANGPDFVAANPWIRKFIRNSKNGRRACSPIFSQRTHGIAGSLASQLSTILKGREYEPSPSSRFGRSGWCFHSIRSMTTPLRPSINGPVSTTVGMGGLI